MVQVSHPWMTTRNTIALTIWTFVGKVISLLFNTLSRFVIAFFPGEQATLWYSVILHCKWWELCSSDSWIYSSYSCSKLSLWVKRSPFQKKYCNDSGKIRSPTIGIEKGGDSRSVCIEIFHIIMSQTATS